MKQTPQNNTFDGTPPHKSSEKKDIHEPAPRSPSGPDGSSEEEGDRFIDASSSEYKRGIFNAIVAPRPIGWISSMSDTGRVNLAPFSYFNIVSNRPAVLMFSCNTPEDRSHKDTLLNVQQTGEFVFNLVSLELVELMNLTSTPLPYGDDEFEFAGIAKAPCRFVRPPRVRRSPAALECKVARIITIGGGVEGPETQVVFGNIVGLHIRDGFLDEHGHFATDLAQPVSRLGGTEFATTNPTFSLERQFVRAGEESY